MNNEEWFRDQPVSFYGVVFLVIYDLSTFFIFPPGWFLYVLFAGPAYYIFCLCLKRYLLARDNDFDTTRKLHFLDWYSHIRFWSFWWWFNPIFLIWVAYQNNKYEKESFVEERFKLEIYLGWLFDIGRLSLIIYLIIICFSSGL